MLEWVGVHFKKIFKRPAWAIHWQLSNSIALGKVIRPTYLTVALEEEISYFTIVFEKVIPQFDLHVVT